MKKKVVLLMVLIMLFSSVGFSVEPASKGVQADNFLYKNYGLIRYQEEGKPSSWAQKEIDEIQPVLDPQLAEDSQLFTKYQDPITREQFIWMLVKIFELKNQYVIRYSNPDVFDDGTEASTKARVIGLTNGIGNNKFGKDDLLTREQLATLVIRLLDISDVKLEEFSDYEFKDEKEFSSWAKSSIYKAKSNNIINGVGGNKFSPNKTATKEEALVIAYNLYTNFDEEAWNYSLPKEEVLGVEFDPVRDWKTEFYLNRHTGYIKEDFLNKVYEKIVDEMEITYDNSTGEVVMKGYIPNGTATLFPHMYCEVAYKEPIDVYIDNDYIDIYNYESSIPDKSKFTASKEERYGTLKDTTLKLWEKRYLSNFHPDVEEPALDSLYNDIGKKFERRFKVKKEDIWDISMQFSFSTIKRDYDISLEEFYHRTLDGSPRIFSQKKAVSSGDSLVLAIDLTTPSEGCVRLAGDKVLKNVGDYIDIGAFR